jgi:4'-phosphopantetheinyl transferase
VSLCIRVGDARAGELGIELWLLYGDAGDDLREEAHVLLRSLLGERLGRAPGELEFVREPCPLCGELHGRPALEGAALHFSLARRPGVALIGIAAAPVGVDIEAVQEGAVAGDVAPLLHPSEREELSAVPPGERALVFARIWTRKEAYLKGIGTGVAGDLAAEYLGVDGRAAGPAGWSVIDVPAPDGFAAAAAIKVKVRVR